MAKLKIKGVKSAKKKLVDDITKKLTNTTQDILNTDVAKFERKTMQEVIKDKTYKKYKPKKYGRRGALNGGLIARENILTLYDNTDSWANLTLINVAEPNDSILGTDITDGDGLLYEWKDKGEVHSLFNRTGKTAPYLKPAKYTETIEKRLYDSGKVKAMIIKELKDKYE